MLIQPEFLLLVKPNLLHAHTQTYKYGDIIPSCTRTHIHTYMHANTQTYLEQPCLDVLVIHELREDEKLLSKELIGEVHLYHTQHTRQQILL